jgi:1-acyl-sn-glycerol-3-phosphate acyltransferase
MLYGFSRAVLYVFFRLYNRFRVFSGEKVPGDGAVIVAANHASYLDPPLMGASMRRRATFVAKEELFRLPVVNFFLRAWSIPVNRRRPGPASVKEAVRRLRAGGLVVIFPEGGIPDGPAVRAKRGVGTLARLSGARVVPAFIEGTERALPPGAWLLRPSRVTVRFGDPVESGHDDEATAACVMREIARLGQEEWAVK